MEKSVWFKNISKSLTVKNLKQHYLRDERNRVHINPNDGHYKLLPRWFEVRNHVSLLLS